MLHKFEEGPLYSPSANEIQCRAKALHIQQWPDIDDTTSFDKASFHYLLHGFALIVDEFLASNDDDK